jgi:hypothetical protein
MIIYKYPIKITDKQLIDMPKGAQLLHVGHDPQGQLCVWARVDRRRQFDPVSIYICGTGQEMSSDAGAAAHLGSFQEGPFLIWHVFWTRRA